MDSMVTRNSIHLMFSSHRELKAAMSTVELHCFTTARDQVLNIGTR